MHREDSEVNILGLNAYWFGVSFMWNALHPIVLPIVLLAIVPENVKNTVYGLITFLGLMVAVVMQPLSGALSDRTRHILGRRRPWVIVGTVLDLAFLAVIVMATSWWMIAVGYILLQFSSNLAHGPAQALLPDLVPKAQRGSAAGMKVLIDMVGVIAAAIVSGRLMGADPGRVGLVILVVVGVLVAGMIWTVLTARERSTQASHKVALHLPAHPWQSFVGVDWRGNRDYTRLLLSRFLVLLGTYSLQSFGLYYLRDVVKVENPARTASSLIAIIAVMVMLSSYPSGALSSRWGRKRMSLLSCGVTALAMVVLVFAPNTTTILVTGCLIGLGMGAYSSVNWAWATELVPQGAAGKYLGLTNLATAGAAASSRLMGPLIDLVNRQVSNAGYRLVFVIAAVGAVVALYVTSRMTEVSYPHPRRRRRDIAEPVAGH